jgi:uncharacterized membrane protein
MTAPDPLDPLFAQARMHRPDTSKAEYGFETRLMARLRQKAPAVYPWSVVAWRLAPLFGVAVAALLAWEVQIAAATDDAEQASYVDTNLTVNSLSSFN